MANISETEHNYRLELLPQEEMLDVGRRHRQYVIGLPREMDKYEWRVALTPLAVKLLSDMGHEVVIEKGAGEYARFSDFDYSEAGGYIVDSSREAYKADIVVKTAPFSYEEAELLGSGQIVMSSLHMPTLREDVIRTLMQKKVTAVAYEHLRDQNEQHPFTRAMSEIAGTSSILVAADILSSVRGGKGILLGGISGITPTEVVIIGAGTAAEFAARTAMGLGAFVKVFDRSPAKLHQLEINLGRRLFNSQLHANVLSKALRTADVVIGALDLIGGTYGYIVTEDMVRLMKQGAVIIDLSIGQGGCFETSRCTNFGDPTYSQLGVIHYCVPNITSHYARSSSIAQSDVVGPFLATLCDSGGIRQLLKENTGARSGVYIYKGILTNDNIGKRFGIPSRDINLLTPTF